MKIWIVAYEQPGEREIFVEAYYSNREAVDRANHIDEELTAQEDTCTATSITEIEIDMGASEAAIAAATGGAP